MLKKLYKYDLKSVSLLLLILHAVLIVYSLVGHIGFSFLKGGRSVSIPLRFLIFGVLQLVFMFWALRYLFLPLLLQQLYI